MGSRDTKLGRNKFLELNKFYNDKFFLDDNNVTFPPENDFSKKMTKLWVWVFQLHDSYFTTHQKFIFVEFHHEKYVDGNFGNFCWL